MNIYEKLQSARVELQKINLKKSGNNKFAGFTYFELSDFLPTVNEIFEKKKLFSNFSVFEGQAKLTIIDIDKTDDIVAFTIPTAVIEVPKGNAMQALGGINTYCKRYLYMNALEICENDLFDATIGKTTKPKEETKTIQANQAKKTEKQLIDELAKIYKMEEFEPFYKAEKENAEKNGYKTFLAAAKNKYNLILADEKEKEKTA